MGNVRNVTAGKPRVAGSVFRAPLGTALPTTADAELGQGYVDLGFISEDGVVNGNSPDSEKIKAWGGQIVLVVNTEREDTFTFSLLETANPEVAKVVYNSDNITIAGQAGAETGFSINVNAEQAEGAVYVFDMKLTNGSLKRIVIPHGELSELGDITYVDEEAVAYEVTIDALPDEEGNSHYEYIKYAT